MKKRRSFYEKARPKHDRTKQVMLNLISNGIKFSPKGGAVEIGLLQHNGKYRVSVSDNGPGIPKEFQDSIFERFSQAKEQGEHKQPGTGLGLALYRDLIELMGGYIGYQTKPGAGTTFFFELIPSDWT